VSGFKGGGGGGPHDVLSVEHVDSDPVDVPVGGDVLTWTGAEWEAQPGGGGGPHAISHEEGGGDPVAIEDLPTASVVAARYPRTDGAGGVDIAQVGHGELGAVTADQHHTQAHAIGGVDHSGAITDAQHGARGPIVGAHGHDDLNTVGANDHHAQAHAIDGADHTGDIETAQIANGAVTTIKVGDNQITLAKLVDIATARILGRDTAGSGDPEELTGTEVTVLLDAFTSALKGLAPASGGGSVNFLRADGTWAAPSGGSGAPTDAQYVVLALNGSLSDERVLTAGEGLRLTDAGAGGAATLNLEAIGHTISTGVHTYTNLGAGPTEIANSGRLIVRIANANEVRAVCHVATAGVTGDLKAQYSTDGTTFVDLTTLIDLSTTGLKGSAWQAVPAGALGDLIYIRMVAVGGNGTEDPVVRSHMVHFR
jgi:hypothetical protein